MSALMSSKNKPAMSRDELARLAKGAPLGANRAITGTWGKEPGSCLVGTIIENEEQEPFRGSPNKSRVVYVEGALYFGADVIDERGEVVYPAGTLFDGVFQWRLDAASQLAWFWQKGAIVRAECNGSVDVGGGKSRTDYVSITSGAPTDPGEQAAHAPAPKKKKDAAT